MTWPAGNHVMQHFRPPDPENCWLAPAGQTGNAFRLGDFLFLFFIVAAEVKENYLLVSSESPAGAQLAA